MSRSLAEEIELLVKDVANNNPAPKKCVISKIYEDNHVDVDIKVGSEIGTIQYRPCLGNPKIDEEAVIIFVEGSINEGYVICNTEEIELVQSDWEETDISSSAYIKNKSFIPEYTSDLVNNTDFVSDGEYKHTDNNFTNDFKDKLNSLENYDDNELRNLIDTKADSDDIISKTSELINDSEFINKNVSDLQNYYLKTEVNDSLNNKADINHTHSKSDITDFPSTVNMTVTFIDDTVKNYTIYGEES